MSAKKGFVLFKFLGIFLVLFVSTSVQAQINSGDTAWILSSSALVLFMTLPGLALFYAGLVQSKNVLSVLCQHFGIACLMSIIWVIIGYSLAFSPGDSSLFGNLSKMFIELPPEALSGGIPEVLFAMFQMTFCIITPALVIGSYVERIKFSVVLLFSALWLIFVYCPVAFWVWGGGFLAEMGVKDFAGGIVVHTTAGVAALVIALVLGKRRTFDSNTMVPPHSPVLTMIGASMLWVGWFGFNGGSALAADQTASMAILVTHIAASIGAFSWILIEWFRFGKPSLVGMATGMVAGLATITPASGFVGVQGAIILGVGGGVLCYIAVDIIRIKLKIDDSLDVFAVHGVGGMFGTIFCGLLISSTWGGVGFDEGLLAVDHIKIQSYAVLVTIIWTVIVTYVILKVISMFTSLRVDEENEIEGLDTSTHGESGYNN
ncbi:MAG: ammonia channel protein [Rickettsiales bacterium]|nr:ammonia channel protein [Rickettsiales bacterium]RPG13719.1 MAG: ammonium transporter [Pelagibacteraceae bacterium TMED195]|tara:strand:+ start:1954 stop:3249 length:1296 start_codon:yes stop_codon:yes gene_type:complete